MSVPSARAWRAWVRRARRRHHGRSRGDVFTDLYMLFWLVGVYGGALFWTVRRHLQLQLGPAPVSREWISVAILLCAAGLAWRGLRTMGPVLASPAEQAWGLATPIDRRAWLLPRFITLLLVGAVVAALATAAVAMLGLRAHALGAAALAGAAYGVAAVGWSVSAQGGARRRVGHRASRWAAAAGAVPLLAGVAVAAAAVAAHYAGRTLPRPGTSLGLGLLVVGVPLAVAGTVAAARTLRRLDRSALGAGAEVAAAAATAALWIDPSLLSRVLEVRRWRRIGFVRSRHFLTRSGVAGALSAVGRLAGLSARTRALLQAEGRRLLRRPGALAAWAGLALAQYAVAVVAPSAAGVAHIILAYAAAGRLSSGLRTVARSPALRRTLGGSETEVRLAHLAVPAAGTALWWWLTLPAGGPMLGAAGLLILAGVIAAAYRAATRPPMDYAEAIVETPFGLIPMGLILALARGPDVLGFVILVQAILGR